MDNFNQSERNYENSLEAQQDNEFLSHENECEEKEELAALTEQRLIDHDKHTALIFLEALEQRDDVAKVVSMLRSHFLCSKNTELSGVMDEAFESTNDALYENGVRA